jgi:beta-N-acetylhexosaminidase
MYKKKRKIPHEKIFIILLVTVALLGSLNVAKAKGWLIPEQPDIIISGNVVKLDSLTLEQKIAQMVIVHGGLHNIDAWKNLQVGGIHFFSLKEPELYKEIIDQFQEGTQIPFLVTADLEGCINPFSYFYNSTPVSEIETVMEAYNKGKEDGQFMKELGFSLNFAPVVDLNDEIWKCRTFPGDEERIAELADAYIEGLSGAGIIATAKHYPGKTLVVKDPHKFLVAATIDDKDLYPYQYFVGKSSDTSYMVSHIIVSGETISHGTPSVASADVIMPLKENIDGMIISDDTTMLGLRSFYSSRERMYIEVFKAGNDLIINFDEDPLEIYDMVKAVKGAVLSGEISEAQIDDSVRRILQAKGLEVE